MPRKKPPRRSKPSAKTPAESGRESAAPSALGNFADALPLTGLIALSVATCLVPSETPPALGWEIPLVMGWMLLLGTYVIIGMRRRTLVLRWDLASAALLVFFIWLCISSAVNLSDSQPRATLNMTFRWLGFAIMFFTARHILVTARLQRAMVAVMISLAVGIGALGLFEYGITKPAQRAAFEANPEGEMQAAGVFAPVDSPAGRQFRDRVYSVEPLATFALTNSLAGFLTPWLLIGFAVVWQLGRKQIQSSQWNETTLLIVLLLGLLLISFCLLLTKSRSAWGASAIGSALLAAGAIAKGLRPSWKWLAGAAAAIVAMVIVAIAAGGLDTEVATEAIKSLSFRLQYWQATGAMITEHPVIGIGLGNFQEHYSSYKLPNASETISDPHNFLLEIIAAAGIPAIVPLLIMLAGVVWYGIRGLRKTSPGEASDSPAQAVPRESLLPIYIGVAMGFVAAVLLQIMTTGVDIAIFLTVAPATACSLLAFTTWIEAGELPIGGLIAGLIALLINLLAAGGIGFASVSICVWLLAAVILAASGMSKQRQLSRGESIGMVLGVSVLVITFFLLAYRPVLNSRMALQTGELLIRQGQYQIAMPMLESAAAADPWSMEPHRLLAVAHQRQWLQSQNKKQFAEFERQAAAAIRLSPYAHTLRMETGHRYLEAYRAADDPQLLAKAIEHQQAAVELNPNESYSHAQLAWLLSEAGKTDEAAASAKRALELDEINTHSERDLAERRLFDVEGKLPKGKSALELMQEIAGKVGSDD